VIVKRAIVATDGSEHGARAVELAAQIARGVPCSLLIVHVVTSEVLTEREHALVETEYASELSARLATLVPDDPAVSDNGLLTPAWLNRQAAQAAAIRAVIGERRLSDAETAARAQGATDVHTLLAHGDPAEAILAAAQNNHADLVVLGSNGFGTIRSFILGSVSAKVSQASPASVLIAR
jgi:nucleotide-binding universal stress UspA family protein